MKTTGSRKYIVIVRRHGDPGLHDRPWTDYVVHYFPTGEDLSTHETEAGAREAISRYRAADRRRSA